MIATIQHSPVVRYHGTMTNMHGLWRVVDGGGLVLKLRDIYGNTLRCRTASVTLVDLPTFTEARATALHALRNTADGRIRAGSVRTWLLNNGLIERTDRRGRYQLTELGRIADDAIRPFWFDGQPVALATAKRPAPVALDPTLHDGTLI